MAGAGGRITNRRIAAVRVGEAALSKRFMSIFDDVDVVVTPSTAAGPPRVGALRHRGALVTIAATMGRSPFQAILNVTGQPAAVVPWGLDHASLPTSVQLASRPAGEATLLALSTQIESARPWRDRRPAHC